jgi:hypothetical protein
MSLWEGLGMGTDDKGDVWSSREWANILKRAAEITEKGKGDCTPLEQWFWWCYPVFSRYDWRAREALDAASFRKFADKDSWEVIDKSEENFRHYWITRGLRFEWRKTSREKPELWDFVVTARVPRLEVVRGVVTWRAA